MQNCAGCDAIQNNINEQFQTAIKNAERIAKEEGKRVAVFVAGQGFETEIITGQIPGGTCYIAPKL